MSAVRIEAAGAPAQGAPERRLLSALLRCFRAELAWVALFSCVANVLMLAPTLYMLQVFDRVMVSRNPLTLLGLTLLVLLVYAVTAFAESIRTWLLVAVGVQLDGKLNSAAFGAAYKAQLRSSAQGAPAQAFSDLTVVRQFATGNAVFALFDLPWTLVYLAVLYLMHPWLGWAGAGFALLLSAVAWWGQRWMEPLQQQALQAQGSVNGFLATKLRCAESVHAMGMMGHLRRRWLSAYGEQAAVQGRAQDAGHRMQSFNKFLQYSQQSLILALGALLTIRGEMSLGALVASNALMGSALRPISTLAALWKGFVEARQSFSRLASLLADAPHEAGAGEPAAAALRGDVGVRALHARVPGRDAPVLQDVSLDIAAGELVVMVGPSGAGKSTLARCLLGIWPDVQGEVLFDGKPLARWPRQALGPQLGYLPQDIELFEGTVADNIARLGQVESAQVIEAARLTGMHETILALPKGYDTPVGEAGQLLSGGQRQRIGLSRALFGNPRLIVLDEPNANLDDAGLAALAQTLRTLRTQGRTVVVVTHHPQLLSVADRVLQLRDGRVHSFGPVAGKPATLSTSQP